MNADAILQRDRGAERGAWRRRSPVGVPGTVFVGPLDDPDAARRGADSVSLPHHAQREPAQSRASRARPSTPPGHRLSQFAAARSVLPGHRRHAPGASEEALLRALGYAMHALQLDPEPDRARASVTKPCTFRSSR